MTCHDHVFWLPVPHLLCADVEREPVPVSGGGAAVARAAVVGGGGAGRARPEDGVGLGGGRAAGGGATRAAAEGLLERENWKVFIFVWGELIL